MDRITRTPLIRSDVSVIEQGDLVQLHNSYDYGCDVGVVQGWLGRSASDENDMLAIRLRNGIQVGARVGEVAYYRSTEIVLDVHICDQRRSYLARFSTEAQAIDFMSVRGSTHAVTELEEYPVPRSCEKLLDVLYPTCEHGLSADLCMGPNHYPTYDQERACGW